METQYYDVMQQKFILRFNNYLMEKYVDGKWVESDYWFNNIFMNDFTDFVEITEERANQIIANMASAYAGAFLLTQKCSNKSYARL